MLRARLRVMAAALLFSTGAVAIKSASLPALEVSCLRSGFATLALALMVQPWRRHLTARVWLVGVAYAAVVTLFVVANKLTTGAHTIYLQSTAPIWVIALSPWLVGTRRRRVDLWSALGLVTGVALLMAAPPRGLETAPDPAMGNVVALAAGFFWALTLIGLTALAQTEKTDARDPPAALDAAFAGNLIAFAVALPLALPFGSLSGPDLIGVLYLGIFQTALAYVVMERGMRHLPAIDVSLLLLLEPVVTPLWTWWLHGETLAPAALLGCALILATSTHRALLDKPD